VLADGGEGDEWGEGRGGLEFEEEGRKGQGSERGKSSGGGGGIDRSIREGCARSVGEGLDWVGLGAVRKERDDRWPWADFFFRTDSKRVATCLPDGWVRFGPAGAGRAQCQRPTAGGSGLVGWLVGWPTGGKRIFVAARRAPHVCCRLAVGSR
jgi:hypothetical protein